MGAPVGILTTLWDLMSPQGVGHLRVGVTTVWPSHWAPCLSPPIFRLVYWARRWPPPFGLLLLCPSASSPLSESLSLFFTLPSPLLLSPSSSRSLCLFFFSISLPLLLCPSESASCCASCEKREALRTDETQHVASRTTPAKVAVNHQPTETQTDWSITGLEELLWIAVIHIRLALDSQRLGQAGGVVSAS